VDTSPGNAQSSALVVDAAGQFHTVFSDDPTGERGVYYARSGDGLTWTPSARIDVPGASTYSPRLAVERESVPIRGRLYAAYQIGSGAAGDIWFTVSDGGAFWFAPRRVDVAPANVSSLFPSVAASNGRVHVAWSDLRLGATYYQIFVRSSSDGGGSWGPETQVSIGGATINLQSRMDAKGDTAVIAWRQSEGAATSIWSSRSDDGGLTWRTNLVAIGGAVTDTLRDPDVVVDELGVAHVVWAHRDATGAWHIESAWSGDGGTWSTPVQIEDVFVAVTAGAPTISVLAGTLWVAWHDNRLGDYDLWASWSDDGIRWGDGVRDGMDLRVDDTDRTPAPGDDATSQFNGTIRTGGYGVFVTWEDARNGPRFDVYFGSIAVSPLVITEIQDEPLSEARVEVYNLGRTPYPMAGVMLSAGTSTVDVSALGSIPARGHVVIGAPPSSDLQASLDMGSEGARVSLRRGTEVLAAAASGPYGIAPDPLPSESTARFAGTLDYTASWTRSVASSFRARNAVPRPNFAPSIVLNEVLFYPASPSPGERFIELYLRATQPLDLTGYRIVSDAIFTFSGGTVSPSYPYVYLFEGRSPGWFAPLDIATDNVYLYDDTGRLLDMVGWTTAHTRLLTVARAISGVGGLRAYDDPSAVANGWVFDQDPSITLVSLVADQRVMADIGTTVAFPLTATNLQSVPEVLNVEWIADLPWPVAFRWPNGTVLSDSAADADLIPDLGLVGPAASAVFRAEVTVPIEGLLRDGNVVTVSVSPATVPVARDPAFLTIDLYPHFDVMRTVNPQTVYLQGTGPPYNEIAQVTVSASGAGLPIVTLVPHDVVFQIDESGSMNGNDPTNLRTEAVKAYIDMMRVDDRGALIGFTGVAWVVNNRPLTYADAMGKVLLKGDADTLACSPSCGGATNIDAALQLGNDWIITYGNRSRPRIEILLTDGRCTVGVPPCPNTNAILDQAVAEGIVIYTVALGADIDIPFLQNIATRTGGQFYQAQTAQDLIAIYQLIGMRVNRTAGIDPDVTDARPMVEDHVPLYLNLVPGSFYDPATGQPRPPEYVLQLPDRTVLQWNVSRILINETWSVRYSVTSTRIGVQDVAWHPDSRVAYTRWDGSTVFQPIPQAQIEVLRAATPPYIELTNPVDGATGVALSQAIVAVFNQDMDWPTVTFTISPPLAVTPSTTARILTLNHGGMAECMEYTVHVTQGRDTEGEDLIPGPVPNPWRFATVCPTRVQYTITRLPVLGDVIVDGTAYPAPATFTWVQSEVHRIEAPDMDVIGASRVVYVAWDDLGGIAHDVTVGAADRTVTATYAWQHRVDLTLRGLQPGRPASVRFELWGAPSLASADAAWSDWADEGSVVETERIVAGLTGERFITLDVVNWTVMGPMQRTVSYYHQYAVNVQLLGLEGHPVGVGFTAFGRPETASSADLWEDWVDAGREVRADGGFTVTARERFRTLDVTRWDIDASRTVTVTYLHQFRPHVTLQGLDATTNHTVGATWRLDLASMADSELDFELSVWADLGAVLEFDAVSTGTPPRYAQSSPQFLVTSAFDATLVYAPTPPPPPEGNWKPVLAVGYTIGILAAGAFGSRRLIDRYIPKPIGGDRRARSRQWATLTLGQKLNELSIADVELKIHKDRTFTRLLLMLPFAAAEASIGVTSYFTGLLRIPESGSWLPLGFWVNTVVLAAGISMSLAVWRRGYRMTNDALLRLAEARERANGRGAAPPGPGEDDRSS